MKKIKFVYFALAMFLLCSLTAWADQDYQTDMAKRQAQQEAEAATLEKEAKLADPQIIEDLNKDALSEDALGSWYQREGLSQELTKDKTIRPGDVLEINVYPQEELSTSKNVDNEGYIFFPYVGKIQVANLTVEELSEKMTKTLGKDYLENPKVFVRKDTSFFERFVAYWKDAHVRPINIFGEVAGPGAYYPLREDVTLLEAVSQRGSFTPSADINNIRLIRVVKNEEVTFIIKAGDIIEGKAPDLIVKRGDLIVVPRLYKSINILGEVMRPGPILVNRFTGDSITLIEAISLAGGFTRIAAANRTRIVRYIEGKEVTIKVKAGKILKGKDKDIVLEPGDLIVVPESFW